MNNLNQRGNINRGYYRNNKRQKTI